MKFNDLETPGHCVHSVIEIRRYLTSELQKLDEDTEVAKKLRAMRAACRKFRNTVQADDDHRIIQHGFQHGHYASWVFNAALGEMRGVFGIHLSRSPLNTASMLKTISQRPFRLKKRSKALTD